MPCPLNGRRNITEFACGGEVLDVPDPTSCSDRTWADYLFMENNVRGVVREWWLHVPSSYWFIAERNTATDEILKTYPADEIFNQQVDYPSPRPPSSRVEGGNLPLPGKIIPAPRPSPSRVEGGDLPLPKKIIPAPLEGENQGKGEDGEI